jgi:WD40 repeat protein
LYISTGAGALYQISPSSRLIECIYQLHNSAINSIFINEGMCVTASDDGFIRVWPLDFSDFFLEAEHESPVLSVAISTDGLSLAVGTRNGSIGVMDMSTQKYKTIVRSHTSDVTSVALDPHRSEFTTVSSIVTN